MGSMGQVKLSESEPHSILKSQESFYKWFLPIQKKLNGNSFNNKDEEESSSLIEYLFNNSTNEKYGDYNEEKEEEEDDDDDLPLDEKKRIEKVKKFLGNFKDSDVLLELAEDERSELNFTCKYRPLETFAVIGGVGFFNIYLKRESEAVKAIESAKKFLTKYEKISKEAVAYCKSYSKSMETVLTGLECFYSAVFSGDKFTSLICNNIILETECDNSNGALGIKTYFLEHFDGFLDDRASLVDKFAQEEESTNSEWNLNRYFIMRHNRLIQRNSSSSKISHPSDEEMQEIETALKKESDNPWNVLGECQFLTDFIAGNTLNELEFAGKKFEKHTDVFNYIKDTSIDITNKHPSFLRANFTFVEIFANELPITRQDREFSRSFLEKALKANPKSSKINHKMGLFLIKGRIFTEGKNYLQKSIEYDPTNASAYYSLAKLFMRDPTGNSNKECAESFFNSEFDGINQTLGSENQLPFWKGCYFFVTGDKEIAIGLWVEVILEFYVSKPELDLETVLPFQELQSVREEFFWSRNPLTFPNIEASVKEAIALEKTRRRVVLTRLLDLVTDAKQLQIST